MTTSFILIGVAILALFFGAMLSQKTKNGFLRLIISLITGVLFFGSMAVSCSVAGKGAEPSNIQNQYLNDAD